MEFTAAEGRVLGCLIEQEAVAPDAVPVTLNALRLACNRTAGRDPVVAFDDRTVEDTLLALKSRGLARFVPPTKDVRTTRYRHRAGERWRMGEAELAVLAVLLLRGTQTVSEVRAQAQRLHAFNDPAEVDAVLDSLAARTPRPFAARVGRRPGEHETRWAQVLTAPAPAPDDEPTSASGDGGRAAEVSRVPAELASPSYAALVARVTDLEHRLVAALEQREKQADDWAPAPFPPPPPPPVEVRSAPAAQLGRGSGDDHGRERVPGSATDSRGGTGGAPAHREVQELADRLRDVERRLARIEAELGALR